MSWTKRQFVTAAFEEIGLAAYTFDLEPEQMQSALNRLDSMVAAWNARGIRLGYPLPGGPDDTDLDADTGVPDAANEAIYTNLAIRIAPSYGKSVGLETKAAAKSSYDALMAMAAIPPVRQRPAGMPAGAGHKNHDRPFLPPDAAPLTTGGDGVLEFN